MKSLAVGGVCCAFLWSFAGAALGEPEFRIEFRNWPDTDGSVAGGDAISGSLLSGFHFEGVSFSEQGLLPGALGDRPTFIDLQIHPTPIGLQVIDESGPQHGAVFEFESGLFDLTAMEFGNWVPQDGGPPGFGRFGASLPARLQIFPNDVPPPFMPGTAEDGWVLLEADGSSVLDEFRLDGDSDPAIPSGYFNNLDRVFFGFGELRGLSSIGLRWSRDNFNNGAAIRILDKETHSEGARFDGPATLHQFVVEASGNEPTAFVTETTRRFTWSRDAMTESDLPLFVGGELDYDVQTTDGAEGEVIIEYELSGVQSVESTGRIRRGFGPSASEFSVEEFIMLSPIGTAPLGDPYLRLDDEFEMLTRVTVNLTPNGGEARVDFSDGWEVRIP